jgi:hypothetical protein
MGAGAGGEGGPITAHDHTVESAKQAAPGGGPDRGLHEGVFQALLEIVGPGLRSAGEPLLFEVRGHGVALSEDVLTRRLFGGLFFGEIAPMLAFAGGRGFEAMETRRLERPIFEPVNKEVKGADGGRLAWVEAGDDGEPWLLSQGHGEGFDALVSQEGHQ